MKTTRNSFNVTSTSFRNVVKIGSFVFTLTNVRFYVLAMREIILAILTSSLVVRFSLSPKRQGLEIRPPDVIQGISVRRKTGNAQVDQSRRSYLSLLECCKTIHGLNGVNCNDYFEFNCYGKTRSNHSFKLRQPLARVNCFCTHSLLELLNSGTLFLKRQCTNRISAFFEVNLESIVKFCKF